MVLSFLCLSFKNQFTAEQNLQDGGCFLKKTLLERLQFLSSSRIEGLVLVLCWIIAWALPKNLELTSRKSDGTNKKVQRGKDEHQSRLAMPLHDDIGAKGPDQTKDVSYHSREEVQVPEDVSLVVTEFDSASCRVDLRAKHKHQTRDEDVTKTNDRRSGTAPIIARPWKLHEERQGLEDVRCPLQWKDDSDVQARLRVGLPRGHLNHDAASEDGGRDEGPEDVVDDSTAVDDRHDAHVWHVKLVKDADANASAEDVVHQHVPRLLPVREPRNPDYQAHKSEDPRHDPELLFPEERVRDLPVEQVRKERVGDGLQDSRQRQASSDGEHENDEPDEVAPEEKDDEQDG